MLMCFLRNFRSACSPVNSFTSLSQSCQCKCQLSVVLNAYTHFQCVKHLRTALACEFLEFLRRRQVWSWTMGIIVGVRKGSHVPCRLLMPFVAGAITPRAEMTSTTEISHIDPTLSTCEHVISSSPYIEWLIKRINLARANHLGVKHTTDLRDGFIFILSFLQCPTDSTQLELGMRKRVSMLNYHALTVCEETGLLQIDPFQPQRNIFHGYRNWCTYSLFAW